MAIVKHIRDNSGSGKEFEDVTTSRIVYDTTPQLGSFNPVTSDGIMKALAGASGEVPVVNPGDAGKVLTAGFDGDTPTVSWEEPQGTEYTAGDGISIDGNNVISCTVQSPTAGAGIDITDNIVSARVGAGLKFNTSSYDDLTGDFFSSPDSENTLTLLASEIDSEAVSNFKTAVFFRLYPSSVTFTVAASRHDPIHVAIVELNADGTPNTSKALFSDAWDNDNFGDFTLTPVSEITWSFTTAYAPDGTLTWDEIESGACQYGYGIILVNLTGGSITAVGHASSAEGDTINAYWRIPGYYYGTIELAGPGVPGLDNVPQGAVLTVGQDYHGDPEVKWVEGVPSTAGVPNSAVLAMGNSGMEWVEGGVPSYMDITSGTVSIARDNTVVTSTADMTSIIVGANVKSAVVQWTVQSTTALPTVTDGTNALKAAVNNPSGLTVGKTYQLSILNDCYTIVEFG